MKKTALLALAVMILVPSFACAEHLLPLQTVLSVGPEPVANSVIANEANQYVSSDGTNAGTNNNGTYEATFIPASAVETDPNMVPQNAAAKGQPVPVQREPRVRIRTKQKSQGNLYWNTGGRGFKSYFN
ncbi:hypothetical protein J6N69_04300 [bacterium]|nr:hypothetical protein [bacterium]MBP3846541.1 hypothetical protein [bacterium]